MQQLVDQYQKDPDVVFLFIHTFENEAEELLIQNIKSFLKQHQYTFRVPLDLKGQSKLTLADQLGLKSIPTKLIIDGKGNIRFMENGGNLTIRDLERFKEKIERAKEG